MKYSKFTARVNVPCTPELRTLIEETSKAEQQPMTTISRQWLIAGAKAHLGEEFVTKILAGIVEGDLHG
jgi:hypothetical protein